MEKVSKSITNCKRIGTAINRAKKELKRKAQKDGLYENFGQRYVRAIEDKFIDISDYSEDMNYNRRKLQRFDKWCMTYDLSMTH